MTHGWRATSIRTDDGQLPLVSPARPTTSELVVCTVAEPLDLCVTGPSPTSRATAASRGGSATSGERPHAALPRRT
jgi:hypothetical protein